MPPDNSHNLLDVARKRALGAAGSHGKRGGPVVSKLYQRIYLAVIGALAITVILTLAVWHSIEPSNQHELRFRMFAEVISESLPAANAPQADQERVIASWATRAGANIALYDAKRRLIAATSAKIIPMPSTDQTQSGFVAESEERYAKRLEDGRWLLVEVLRQDHARKWTIVVALILVAIAAGIAVYPVVRKITGRLEELQSTVEALGAGNLEARVNFTGNDEVASLAESFNRSAARIEALLRAQKTLLANASHELRSPLARIQMALGLVGTSVDESARQEINRSIRELDNLIGEILLASRIEAENFRLAAASRPIDLSGIVAEEAAKVQAHLQGSNVHVLGDAILLRRLVRNLLENAQRYGRGSLIEVTLAEEEQFATIQVCDRGPGVPEYEREKVFEPFYRLHGSSEKDGGVGLGLALVRSIAKQHGGDARCLPREGGGACFYITIPVYLDFHA
jgi:signal transduction histidine kinase